MRRRLKTKTNGSMTRIVSISVDSVSYISWVKRLFAFVFIIKKTLNLLHGGAVPTVFKITLFLFLFPCFGHQESTEITQRTSTKTLYAQRQSWGSSVDM